LGRTAGGGGKRRGRKLGSALPNVRLTITNKKTRKKRKKKREGDCRGWLFPKSQGRTKGTSNPTKSKKTIRKGPASKERDQRSGGHTGDRLFHRCRTGEEKWRERRGHRNEAHPAVQPSKKGKWASP